MVVAVAVGLWTPQTNVTRPLILVSMASPVVVVASSCLQEDGHFRLLPATPTRTHTHRVRGGLHGDLGPSDVVAFLASSKCKQVIT